MLVAHDDCILACVVYQQTVDPAIPATHSHSSSSMTRRRKRSSRNTHTRAGTWESKEDGGNNVQT